MKMTKQNSKQKQNETKNKSNQKSKQKMTLFKYWSLSSRNPSYLL